MSSEGYYLRIYNIRNSDFKDYSKVTTTEYTFNLNGAMNKGIVSKSGTSQLDGISYNVLNLPREMVINNTEVKAKNYYTYTATRTKLKVVYRYDPNGLMMPLLGTTPEQDGLKPKSMTDYVGNKIYEDGVLKMTLTDNGYYDNLKNTYYFYIKDHLGNNRIVADAAGKSVQSNQYYPFGMVFAEGTTTEQGKQEFKYNGKELDRTHGLNWYDYSARQLDNAIGRFTTMDPMSEKYYSISPYVYVANNPMRLIDPDGKDWYKNEDGTAYMWRKGNDASFTHTIGEGDNAMTMKMTNIGERYVNHLSDGTLMVWDQNSLGGISEPQSLKQGNISLVQSLANSDNFAINLVYNTVNDIAIVAQKLTFGYFDKTNEFTGGGAATNIDGTTNHQEAGALLNTIAMFSGYITNKGATTLGAKIPEGIGYIKPKQGFWGASAINTGIGFVNGSISRGGIIKSFKGLGKAFNNKEDSKKESN
ncbi:RHS repeat-associated protein [Dysgonomonas alginatilytica]|uniref:RHS repeat-associated protein n=2 Tax=Dysgonomonas alginatilytica TaxID=1605892 RepID=A0A2V3PQP3_9BACT|nr:RHS repeat-associated protein [Dysgonomonas alginatilytica]